MPHSTQGFGFMSGKIIAIAMIVIQNTNQTQTNRLAVENKRHLRSQEARIRMVRGLSERGGARVKLL